MDGPTTWAALPPGRQPRWLIPRDPRTARAALSVFQPMTLRGRLWWQSAQLLAQMGAFYLLPTRRSSDIADASRPFVSSGATVAISVSRGGRRGVVLELSRGGRPSRVMKIALDAEGRHRLAREAEWLARAQQLLGPPLSAPRVLDVGEGVIVFEPVRWLPRRRPWVLSGPLAEGIGRLHAAVVDVSGRSGHPGHGDFAPWNVMKTQQGWVILDWEEATPASPPYADPFHYLVQGHSLLGRPRAKEILEGLEGRGWVGTALATYSAAANLAEVDPRRAFVHYLRRSMPADNPSRRDHVRGLRARRELLGLLGEAEAAT